MNENGGNGEEKGEREEALTVRVNALGCLLAAEEPPLSLIRALYEYSTAAAAYGANTEEGEI